MKYILAIMLAILPLWISNDVDAARVMNVSAYTHTGNVMANGEYPYVGAVYSDD